MQILLGFFATILIAFGAYRARSLSGSGAAAAVIVGTLIFGFGGWEWALLLLAFFISSSGLTRAFRNRKSDLSEKYSKGGRRDAAQVAANGGPAALFAGLHFFIPEAAWVWAAFAGALAAVNADTWATELGVLDAHPPRMISDLRREVERGTSGGVSRTGTLAALGGSALIGILAGILGPDRARVLDVILPVTLCGLLGALFDSYLGATVQAMYYCPSCDKETERHPLHGCGTPTTLKRGLPWLNNEWVNLGCAAMGATLAALARVLLFANR